MAAAGLHCILLQAADTSCMQSGERAAAAAGRCHQQQQLLGDVISSSSSWASTCLTTPLHHAARAGLPQEAVVIAPRVAFALRPTMGEWYYVRISVEDMRVEEMTAAHYLAFKEKLVPLAEGEDGRAGRGKVYSPTVVRCLLNVRAQGAELGPDGE